MFPYSKMFVRDHFNSFYTPGYIEVLWLLVLAGGESMELTSSRGINLVMSRPLVQCLRPKYRQCSYVTYLTAPPPVSVPLPPPVHCTLCK